MKKYLMLIMPVAAIAVACSSGNTNDAQTEEVTTIVIDTFYSADRAFADVRGDVKQCVVITTDMEQSADTLRPAEEALVTTLTQKFDSNGYIAEVLRADTFMDQPVGSSNFTFEFDEAGNLVSSNSDIGGRFLVKRNGDGHVTTFTSIGSNGDTDYTKVYTWNGDLLKTQQIANERHPVDEDGKPIPMPFDKVSYTYDDNGYCISEVEESGDLQFQVNVTETTYDYKDYDQHGNWTSRNVNRVAKVYKVGFSSGHRTLTDSIATFQNERRTIEYN